MDEISITHVCLVKNLKSLSQNKRKYVDICSCTGNDH